MSASDSKRDLDSFDWNSWRPDQEATLLFVFRDSEVLLIHKKRGLGAGKVNGPGGRLGPGETPMEAAVREFREELECQPLGVEKAGEVLFHVLDDVAIRIHVFRARDCDGVPRETDEATPLWTPVDRMPFDEMWEDDRYWFPHLLEGTRFQARTVFRGDRLLEYQIITGDDVG